MNLLHLYIYVLFFVKMLLLILILHDIGLKIKNSFVDSDKILEKIGIIKQRKDIIERVFLCGVYILLMYLFYPLNGNSTIHVDTHTKILLFVTGIISIIHTVFKIE